MSQNAKVQMESDAVVFESDFSTGDKVSIAKVMTNDDFKFINLLLSEAVLVRQSAIKVITTVNGMGFTLCSWINVNVMYTKKVFKALL